MNGIEIITIVIVFLVLYFGKYACTSYLENRKEIRIKKIADNTQIETLEFISSQYAEKANIIMSEKLVVQINNSEAVELSDFSLSMIAFSITKLN